MFFWYLAAKNMALTFTQPSEQAGNSRKNQHGQWILHYIHQNLTTS